MDSNYSEMVPFFCSQVDPNILSTLAPRPSSVYRGKPGQFFGWESVCLLFLRVHFNPVKHFLRCNGLSVAVTLGTNFTLAELGICEPSPHRSGYCSDMGILHQGYSLSTGSDADSDTEGGMSPEHAIRLWGRGIKSRRSSGLSSRENSALTLTDSDNENKSDDENGRPASYVPFHVRGTAHCGAWDAFLFFFI